MTNCPKCMASIREEASLPYNCSCGARITERSQLFVCPHLGEPTGETIGCRTCGKGVQEMPVYHCAIHGKTMRRRPARAAGRAGWEGRDCLRCLATTATTS